MMMKLGEVHCTKNFGRVRIWGNSPRVRTPKNVTLGYDVGKISAGCLVSLSLTVRRYKLKSVEVGMFRRGVSHFER